MMAQGQQHFVAPWLEERRKREINRMVGIFQMLEKLVPVRESTSSAGNSLVGRYIADDIQQLRYHSSKILQYVTSQDREHRDVVLKNTDYIDCLLRVLETSGDKLTSLNVVYILVELVLRLSSPKRLAIFVSHGATQVLLHVLAQEAKSDDCSIEFLVTIHQLLSKLGPRDRKFGVKARLYQTLGVSLTIIRNYISIPKVLQPVIHVIKLYAADAVNACYLGKNGLVTYLFKIFSICQRKQLILLKHAVDTLGLLVKSRSNAARAVGNGGVAVLLNMFTDWHKVDTSNKHVSLRKSLLNALKNITEIKSGRVALMDSDGIRILYCACQETVDCRELESLICLANTIMRKCFPKNRLPVPTLRSPLTFALPDSDIFGSAVLFNDDDNEYESSLDNDDDISSDEDGNGGRLDSDDDMDETILHDTSFKRSWDDLCVYKQFFSELYEFDPILQDADPSYRPMNGPVVAGLSAGPVCIQPVPPSQLPNGSSLCGTQSFSVLQTEELPPVENLVIASSNIPRRLSLGALKVTPNHRLAAGPGCSSSIIMDSTGNGASKFSSRGVIENASTESPEVPRRNLQLAPPSTATVGRSPKLRRKTPKPGKTKEKKKPLTGKQLKTKSSATDDWQRFDFNSVLSALASSASGIDTTSAAFKNATALCDVKIEDASADEDGGPAGINGSQQLQTDIGEFGSQRVESPELFAQLASATKSVGRFNKLAYPDLHGHFVTPFREPFYEKKFGIQRNLILQDIDRFINPDQVINRVVYDLDDIVAAFQSSYIAENSYLENSDDQRVRSKDVTSDCLEFSAQFESGNLRKAIQVRKYEYDLILNPDINVNHQHQWFYFEVSNMEAAVPYRFNIINCEKLNSQFNFGMRPVMFSVAEALQGRPYWYRVGTKLCYYKNHFVRSTQTTGGVRGKTYYTASFTVTFKQERDVCYLAYHYPYTYTMLQYHLYQLESEYDSGSIYYRNQSLCDTVSGNSVPLLTITSHPLTYDKEGVEQLKNRPYVFLTSRVHPGESNASWVMKGTLELLLSDKPIARTLRGMYIFKVVPMLNPDGVINGHHRCSLVGEDLNRRWFRPCPKRHPTIYHTKGLMQYLQQALGRGPLVFCDYHGHSRRKNVFMYGCSPFLSWLPDDADNPTHICKGFEDPGYKLLPKLLHQSAPAFSLSSCSFVVEKVKETTARVVVWRQLGVVRSYTMESSYCGCDQGPYKGQHINTHQLEEMGCKFAEVLAKIRTRTNRLPRPASSSMLRVLPTNGLLDDDYDVLKFRYIPNNQKSYDVMESFISVRQVAADDGSSSMASGALSDADISDNDLEIPVEDDLS